MTYQHIRIPTSGEKITVKDGKLHVPDQPIVGCGRRRHRSRHYQGLPAGLDAAVEEFCGGQRKINWCEIFGRESRRDFTATYFPDETLKRSKSWSWPSRVP